MSTTAPLFAAALMLGLGASTVYATPPKPAPAPRQIHLAGHRLQELLAGRDDRPLDDLWRLFDDFQPGQASATSAGLRLLDLRTIRAGGPEKPPGENLSCAWSFRTDDCLSCKPEEGVGAVHEDNQPTFRAVYEAWLSYPLGEDLAADLLKPLRFRLAAADPAAGQKVLDFLETHQDVARKIASNGREFIASELTIAEVERYWLDLLREYAALQRFTPKKDPACVLVPAIGVSLYRLAEHLAPGQGPLALLVPLGLAVAGALGFSTMARQPLPAVEGRIEPSDAPAVIPPLRRLEGAVG